MFVDVGKNTGVLTLDHLNAVGFQLGFLFRVVGHQDDFVATQGFEHVSRHFEVTQVVGKTEVLVGFESVHALGLQVVGVDFVVQTDAAALPDAGRR